MPQLLVLNKCAYFLLSKDEPASCGILCAGLSVCETDFWHTGFMNCYVTRCIFVLLLMFSCLHVCENYLNYPQKNSCSESSLNIKHDLHFLMIIIKFTFMLWTCMIFVLFIYFSLSLDLLHLWWTGTRKQSSHWCLHDM